MKLEKWRNVCEVIQLLVDLVVKLPSIWIQNHAFSVTKKKKKKYLRSSLFKVGNYKNVSPFHIRNPVQNLWSNRNHPARTLDPMCYQGSEVKQWGWWRMFALRGRAGTGRKGLLWHGPFIAPCVSLGPTCCPGTRMTQQLWSWNIQII